MSDAGESIHPEIPRRRLDQSRYPARQVPVLPLNDMKTALREQLDPARAAQPDVAAPHRHRVFGNAALPVGKGESLILGTVPAHHLVRESEPNISFGIVHHGAPHPGLFSKSFGLSYPPTGNQMVGASAAGRDPR